MSRTASLSCGRKKQCSIGAGTNGSKTSSTTKSCKPCCCCCGGPGLLIFGMKYSLSATRIRQISTCRYTSRSTCSSPAATACERPEVILGEVASITKTIQGRMLLLLMLLQLREKKSPLWLSGSVLAEALACALPQLLGCIDGSSGRVPPNCCCTPGCSAWCSCCCLSWCCRVASFCTCISLSKCSLLLCCSWVSFQASAKARGATKSTDPFHNSCLRCLKYRSPSDDAAPIPLLQARKPLR